MTDPKQIPHLINLLDDESSEVHNQVIDELVTFGLSLKDEIKKLSLPLNTLQQQRLKIVFQNQRRQHLKQIWPGWFNSHEDCQKLEKALLILSDFLSEEDDDESLKIMLDRLAYDFVQSAVSRDAKSLARFLFKKIGLQGNIKDYYNPQNSNLKFVIQQKKGIPISLTSIYMLVGYRLGIRIEGCLFPGHFLARVEIEGREVYIDCFNSGQILEKKDIVRIRKGNLPHLETLLKEKSGAQTIIRRYLANLIHAFGMSNEEENSQLMMELFTDLDIRLNDQKIATVTPNDIIAEPVALFKPANLIRHKLYGYRGIVVDVDSSCKATDSWYYGNQNQPSRHQPWFHVLVHDSDHVTYVAQDHLSHDQSRAGISHPLLSYFFVKNEQGHYVRNDTPWPDTDI